MFFIERIKSFEVGLLFRYGDFVRTLPPGRHVFWSRLWNYQRAVVTKENKLKAKFQHPLLDVMLRNEALARQLEVVDLADDQRAIIWKDGRIDEIVGPGRHAYWKEPSRIDVEIFDTSDLRLEHPKLDAIVGSQGSSRWLVGVDVEDHEDVLLMRDGEIVQRLGKGRHVFWRNVGKVSWKAIDRREQVADVTGQEIMTRDKVTLRVNLLVTFQVVDAVKSVTVVADHAKALYREAQLALRAAVGTRTLDVLLADKESVSGELRNTLSARAAEFGVAVKGVGLKDIILPGDMKAILNRVIEAEKEAQANLIKRREETAAARSQANTAKLLTDNPALARMRELEQLGEILAGSRSTFVFGSGDIAEQVRGLVTAGDAQTGSGSKSRSG